MSVNNPVKGLSKAQRLELAATIAPVLRNATEKTKTRRAKFYNQETGEVTGEGTVVEALKGLAKIHDLEHTLEEGIRPKEITCRLCGRSIRVKACGPAPTTCTGALCQQEHCGGYAEIKCKKRPTQGAFTPRRLAARNGGPWRCKQCAPYQRLGLDHFQDTQTQCAGYNGYTCDKDVPSKANSHSKRLLRKGPWRCRSCSVKKAFENPDYRAKYEASIKRRENDAEYVQNRRVRSKKFMTDLANRPGYREQLAAQMSRTMAKLNSDPEYRKKRGQQRREWLANNPQWSAKQAEVARRVVATPEFRAGRTEAMKKGWVTRRVNKCKKKAESDHTPDNEEAAE